MLEVKRFIGKCNVKSPQEKLEVKIKNKKIHNLYSFPLPVQRIK